MNYSDGFLNEYFFQNLFISSECDIMRINTHTNLLECYNFPFYIKFKQIIAHCKSVGYGVNSQHKSSFR